MSKSWKERNQARRKFWRSHLKHWSKSNISQLEYCRQNDLIPHQFTYWKTKFKNKNLPIEFIQISPEPICVDLSNLKLNIGQGLQIEIPDGFASTTLERILTTLKVL